MAAAISGDGRLVAYSAKYPREQVGPGYGKCRKDNVIVRDLETGEITLAGLDSDGRCVDQQVQDPSMSGDGYLAFDGNARLVDEDDAAEIDVYGVDLS